MGQIGGLELFLLCTCSFFGAFLELRLRQGQLFVFRFCRVVGVYIGYRASATGAIDVGMNLGDQIRRVPRRLTGFKCLDHAGKPVMAAEQQVRQSVIDREFLLGQSFKQVFQFVGQITHGRNVGQSGATLEGVQVTLEQPQEVQV